MLSVIFQIKVLESLREAHSTKGAGNKQNTDMNAEWGLVGAGGGAVYDHSAQLNRALYRSRSKEGYHHRRFK